MLAHYVADMTLLLQNTLQAPVLKLSDACETKVIELDHSGRCVAAFRDDTLLILHKDSCTGEHSLTIINADGSGKRHFTPKGDEAGQLGLIEGVAVDYSRDEVYVAERSGRIQVFTSAGKFVRLFCNAGTYWNKDLRLQPILMAFDTQRSLLYFYSPSWKHDVQVFTRAGKLLRNVKLQITPDRMALTAAGELIVTSADRSERNPARYMHDESSVQVRTRILIH